MATRTPSRLEKSGRGMRCDALLPTPRPRRIAGPRCDATPFTKLRPNEFFREGDLFGEGVALGDSGMDGNLLRSLPPNVSPFSAEVLCGVRGDCGGAGPAARSSAGVVPSGPRRRRRRRSARRRRNRAPISPPRLRRRGLGRHPPRHPRLPSLASATNSHAACISALRSTPSPTTCASCAATPVTNVGERSGSSADPGFEPWRVDLRRRLRHWAAARDRCWRRPRREARAPPWRRRRRSRRVPAGQRRRAGAPRRRPFASCRTRGRRERCGRWSLPRGVRARRLGSC